MSHNQTIIVSGCTKGIGLAICNLFAANGWNVAGFARNASDIKQLQSLLEAAYPSSKFYFESIDAKDIKNHPSFVEKVVVHCGNISVLVNNTGVFTPGNLLTEPAGNLEHLIETNLYSAYYLSRMVVPHMNQAGKGHIINMCSIAGLQAYENGGSYSISKFAMIGMSKQLRYELKSTPIKVTAIMPGATYTASWEGVDLPKSRFIPAEDIAQIVWDATKLSPSTTVEEIIVRPQPGDI